MAVVKGLSVGDIFEDGGLYYEVKAVHEDGSYYSEKTEKPEERPAENPGAAANITTTKKKRTRK